MKLQFIHKRVYILHVTAPGTPTISMGTTAPTTITLSWTNNDSVMSKYEVIWERDTSGECDNMDEGSNIITNGSTSYTIRGLQEDSNYIINVTATNAAGSAVSVPVTAVTGEAGEGLSGTYELKSIQIMYFLSAPSAPPTTVSTSNVTNSSIIVKWGPVLCIHRNGNITGYTVQYEAQGSGGNRLSMFQEVLPLKLRFLE